MTRCSLIRISGDEELRGTLTADGQHTAAANDQELLVPAWEALLDGFVHEPEHAGAPAGLPQTSPAWRRQIHGRRRVVMGAVVLLLLLGLFAALPEELGDKPYDPGAIVRIAKEI